MTVPAFKEWVSRKALMPNGDEIVCYFFAPSGANDVSLHDENHNVYRLDTHGNIIWQVQRDDSNHAPDWWDRLHKHARDDGNDGAREPFTEIRLEYADGSTSWDKQAYQWRNPCDWKPGCKIWAAGSAYQNYVLDPETGIAKNVTDWPVRPW